MISYKVDDRNIGVLTLDRPDKPLHILSSATSEQRHHLLSAPAEPEAVARPPSIPLPNVQDPPQTLSLAASPPPPLEPGDRVRITLSFYYCEYLGAALGDGGRFCGLMRDGTVVYSGAAACDIAYLGQIFRIAGDPTGRIYRCADTGSAIGGSHRDIWFQTNTGGWDWLQMGGDSVVVEVLA